MSALNIIVCDDNKRRAEDWLASIRNAGRSVDVTGVAIAADDLKKAAAELAQREIEARSKIKRRRRATSANPFDGRSVAFIDYDLVKVDHLDGENLARLVRCYSDTAVVVVVNREIGAFDLRLKAEPTAWADVDLHSTQIGNEGLWSEPWAGFRPWHWPLLPQAVKAFRRNVKEFRRRLDQPIATALGLTADMLAVLPESVWEQVARGSDRSKATVRQVVDGVPMGLRPKERLLDDDAVTRFAVARLTKWLCQVVLPGQNILIDAPHLVSRLPCLLGRGKKPTSGVLNELSLISKTRPKGLDDRLIRPYAFDANGLLDRPAWFWPSVSKDINIPDIKEPWNVQPLPLVFCEDLSQFVAPEAARQFKADVDSPYSARFVANPRSPRLSAKLREAIRGVSYEPVNRFAL